MPLHPHADGSDPPDPPAQSVFTDQDLANLGITPTPPPPQKRRRRKKKVSRREMTYRVMFIVGLILGAFTSLLLPFKTWRFNVSGHKIVIPFNVVQLHVWERIAIYGVVVLASGFLWSKLAVDFYDRYFPAPPKREEPPDDGQQRSVYRLD